MTSVTTCRNSRWPGVEWPSGQESDLVPGFSAAMNVELGLTLRHEARERRIISNVKPFSETLRVTNPVR